MTIWRSKKNTENYPKKAFEWRNKETQIKIEPWVSAKQLSNNWAFMLSHMHDFIGCFETKTFAYLYLPHKWNKSHTNETNPTQMFWLFQDAKHYLLVNAGYPAASWSMITLNSDAGAKGSLCILSA